MSVVGIGIISKRGEGRKYLPLEIRAKMYEDVVELRKQGLTCKEIQKIIYEKYRIQISITGLMGNINHLEESTNLMKNPHQNLNILMG
jgi:hypothetical protein